MGIWLGFSVFIVVALLSHISNMMYLRVKDLAGGRFNSIYELAYVFYGRSGIFTVCVVQYIVNFAAIILYFIVLGEVFASMAA